MLVDFLCSLAAPLHLDLRNCQVEEAPRRAHGVSPSRRAIAVGETTVTGPNHFGSLLGPALLIPQMAALKQLKAGVATRRNRKTK